MRTYDCQCGGLLFFESTQCLKCKCDSGMCTSCRTVTSIDRKDQSTWVCGNKQCGTQIQRCGNFSPNAICSRLIPVGDADALCDYCQLTEVIPDLAIDGNIEKWRRLEHAKQRVLHQIDQIGLMFRDSGGTLVPKLSFEFKDGAKGPVSTGHDQGQIVVNIIEADSVQRERTRVEFGEPQRTLVGHFRHELGHFFWDRLVQFDNARLTNFRNVFGDETNPNYDAAIASFYQTGPAQNWKTSYVSAYATMHPWEDFAETFATYLEIRSVVDNANHFMSSGVSTSDFDALIKCHCKVGMMANEFNRDMGLLDLVPQVFVGPVIEKLKLIHSLTDV